MKQISVQDGRLVISYGHPVNYQLSRCIGEVPCVSISCGSKRGRRVSRASMHTMHPLVSHGDAVFNYELEDHNRFCVLL